MPKREKPYKQPYELTIRELIAMAVDGMIKDQPVSRKEWEEAVLDRTISEAFYMASHGYNNLNISVNQCKCGTNREDNPA